MLSLENLHAKVYVFDQRKALVTSANATRYGFHHNAECGMALENEAIARRLVSDINSGFGAETRPSVWKEGDLRALIPAIERLKVMVPEVSKFRVEEGEEAGELELKRADAETLLESTGTWTDLVYRNMINVPEEFTAQQIYDACRADYVRQYPNNNNPDARIRNRLQALRDLGFVHFYGRGKFRRLIKIAR